MVHSHAAIDNDLGTQLGPLLGPDCVMEFLYPEYRRLFDLYRSHNVMIGFHSCGCVNAFLDMFMDLGVNVLNPIQVTANNLDAMRAKTMGRMALQGGISTVTLMDGSVDAIEEEVSHRIWQLGREGGYFCSEDQGMPFPPAHYAAMVRAREQYGRYPLAR